MTERIHQREGHTMTFVCPGGGRFQVGSSALATMQEYVQDKPDKPEAGGVLLGRHILDSADIIVDRVTVPMPGDRRSRLRFFRARRRHQEEIDRAFRDSGGTSTYLGEWHTHPQTCPIPSLIDKLEWRRKLMFDRFTEPIFFVIVGTTTISVWTWHRRGRLVPVGRIVRL